VSGLLYDPEEWRYVLESIKDGRDEAALNILRSRDMRADGQFQVIDEKFYTPTLMQGADTSVAFDVMALEGLRVGPWVQLNVAVEATESAGGNGSIRLTLPTQLPARTIAHRTIGSFLFWDQDADVSYVGAAVTGVLSNIQVYGVQDEGTWDNMHGSVTIASGDRVGFSVQYLVDPEAL
jgi:hypothetical protein